MKNLSVRKEQLVRPRITLGQVLSKSAGLSYCSLAKPDSFTQRPDVVT